MHWSYPILSVAQQPGRRQWPCIEQILLGPCVSSVRGPGSPLHRLQAQTESQMCDQIAANATLVDYGSFALPCGGICCIQASTLCPCLNSPQCILLTDPALQRRSLRDSKGSDRFFGGTANIEGDRQETRETDGWLSCLVGDPISSQSQSLQFFENSPGTRRSELAQCSEGPSSHRNSQVAGKTVLDLRGI